MFQYIWSPKTEKRSKWLSDESKTWPNTLINNTISPLTLNQFVIKQENIFIFSFLPRTNFVKLEGFFFFFFTLLFIFY